jgi:hypothetical protein
MWTIIGTPAISAALRPAGFRPGLRVGSINRPAAIVRASLQVPPRCRGADQIAPRATSVLRMARKRRPGDEASLYNYKPLAIGWGSLPIILRRRGLGRAANFRLSPSMKPTVVRNGGTVIDADANEPTGSMPLQLRLVHLGGDDVLRAVGQQRGAHRLGRFAPRVGLGLRR